MDAADLETGEASTPEEAAAFGLELKPTSRVSGATDDEDDSTMAIVNLNSSGSGEIVYDVIDKLLRTLLSKRNGLN